MSISLEYNSDAHFRRIAPLAERGRGLVGAVTTIISLNILAKDGAKALDSSTTGLATQA